MTAWCRSSAGSVSGKSERVCAPRLSSRSSAQRGDQARERVRVARAAARGPRRRARGRRRATAPRASRALGGCDRLGAAGGSPAVGRAARRARRSAARAPKTKHSRQRVGGQAVGAVQAGAGALADRVEARAPSVAPSRSVTIAAHHVVRGRRDGHQLGRRDRGPASRSALDDVREQRRVDRAHVEVDARPRRSRCMLRPDRARDLVARRELLDEALAVGVEQRGALAADRLGDEEALAALDAGHRGRVELHELEVGERGAGAAGEQQADAERARRVGRALPQRGRAAGGEDRPRARGSRARPRRRRRRSARRATHSVGGAGAFEDRRSPGVSTTTAESWRTTRRPVALPPACTTRRREWPPSRPSARLPWRSASKRTPRRSRSPTVRGRLVGTGRVAALGARARGRRARCPRRCSSGESSTASAAASPPCAQ